MIRNYRVISLLTFKNFRFMKKFKLILVFLMLLSSIGLQAQVKQVSKNSGSTKLKATYSQNKNLGTKIVLTSNADVTLATEYDDPTWSYGTDDPIFVFYHTDDFYTYRGTLTCPAPVEVNGTVTYNWYKFNSCSQSYEIFQLNGGSTITNLKSGGYLVLRTNGTVVDEGRAWIWDNTAVACINATDTLVCLGNNIKMSNNLIGDFKYYNPNRKPDYIDANTIITFKFNVTHPKVKELEFWMNTPCQATYNPINLFGDAEASFFGDGANITDLTFTSSSTALFNYTTAATPLSGIYGGGESLIDWSDLYGDDANASGWGIMIVDRVPENVGTFDNVTITFDFGNGNVITYSSGNVGATIHYYTEEYGYMNIYREYNYDFNYPYGDIKFETSIVGYQWSKSTVGENGPWTNVQGYIEPETPEYIRLSESPVVTTWYHIVTTDSYNYTSEYTRKITVLQPPVANAGIDQTVGGLTTTLAGNSVATGETGTWSVYPTGYVTFENNSSYNTKITASNYSTNVLTWTVDNGTCKVSDDVTIIFKRFPQTITFAALTSKVCGDAPYTISATGGASALPVIFTSSDPTVATCSGTNGSTITMISAGTCYIYANQAGNVVYEPAPQITQQLVVTKGSQTITFNKLESRIIEDATLTLSATGGKSGNAIVFTSSDPTVATCSGTNGTSVELLKLGTTYITAKQAGNACYLPATDVLQPLYIILASTNYVTPNGDGKNDTWAFPQAVAMDGYHLTIFNNIGQKVYESDGYDNSWDGSYKNSSARYGTYYYIFENGTNIFKGYITVQEK